MINKNYNVIEFNSNLWETLLAWLNLRWIDPLHLT